MYNLANIQPHNSFSIIKRAGLHEVEQEHILQDIWGLTVKLKAKNKKDAFFQSYPATLHCMAGLLSDSLDKSFEA